MKDKLVWLRDWFWAIRTYGPKYAIVSFLENRKRRVLK